MTHGEATLFAISHQLRIANLLKLHELKDHPGADKNVLRRIGDDMDRLPEFLTEKFPAEDSGAGAPLDPAVMARNARAFTLEILHNEVDQLRRRADNLQAREALHTVQNLLEQHINANITEGRTAGRNVPVNAARRAAGLPEPLPRADSYRDPDLSEKWLDEAWWRAGNDSGKAYLKDSRKIIKRLILEVRRLNKALGR